MCFTEAELVKCIPALRRYARYLRKDADDVLQDTLMRAWTRRDLFTSRGKGSLQAWLCCMMHNINVSQQRKRIREQGAVLLGLPEFSPDEADTTVVVREFARALQGIPPEQVEVIRLVALEGLSYEEAAQATNSPIGTVRSRLSRGRQELKRRFEGELR